MKWLKEWQRSDVIAGFAVVVTVAVWIDSRSSNAKASLLEASRLVGDASWTLDTTFPPPQPLGERIRVDSPDNRSRRVQAEQQIRRAIQLEPELSSAHRALSLFFLQNGRYADAASEVRRAIELDSTDPESYAIQGHVYLSESKFPEADAAYRRTVALDVRNIPALNGLGEIARREGKYAEALTWFERASAADPNDALSKYNLGKTLALLGKLSEAEAAFRACIVLNPSQMPSKNALEAWISLAALHANAGDLQAAEAALRRALDVNPTDPVATQNLAIVLAQAGELLHGRDAMQKFDEAERLFRGGLARAPNSVQMHLNFALFLVSRDRFDEAEPVVRVVLRLVPNERQAILLLECIEGQKQSRVSR